MLANQLTEQISKKLLIGLLIVAIGSDIALFLSRESYFFETMYSNIMLFSILIGLKLAPRLSEGVPKKTKRQLFSTFVNAFVLLYLIGMMNDYYSSRTFTDFSEDRSLIAESFSEKVADFEASASEADEYTLSDRMFEWMDSIGFDFYDYFLAGLEEVWRLSYIVLFLLFFKKIMPGQMGKDGWMIGAIIFSSLMFGVGHSLSYEQGWTVWVGTVVCYTNMGVVLGYLLISTRNLWLLVVVHGLYNVFTTMTWSYFAWTTELFVVLLLIVNGVLVIVEKNSKTVGEAQNLEL